MKVYVVMIHQTGTHAGLYDIYSTKEKAEEAVKSFNDKCKEICVEDMWADYFSEEVK